MKINKEKAELIGAIIGDGHIYSRNKHYRIGFTGSPVNDFEYFTKLKRLISNVWNKEAHIKRRGRGLYIIFSSKEIFSELVNFFRLPYGEGKCQKVVIPSQIYSKWNLVKHTIRGIVDTDGSVFVADKIGFVNYPTIEISTTSPKLAKQLKCLLQDKGFRVANIASYMSKFSKRVSYKVTLNGHKNLTRWIKNIGFSNPYKLRRALKYSKLKNGLGGTFRERISFEPCCRQHEC